MLILKNSTSIGSGSERSVYIHPNDPSKLVKIIHRNKNLQTKREINHYKNLIRRLPNADKYWLHIPRYYGTQATDLGEGQVFEAIRDFDGQISKTFLFYLERDGVDSYREELDELKCYLLRYCIIFNHDISSPLNIVLKRTDHNKQRLVIVDALGDTIAIKLLNIIPYIVRKKILRRWERFEKNLLKFQRVPS